MKLFDTLITTQETSALYKVPFLKKSRKNVKKGHFWKKCIFYVFFSFFQKWDFAERWGFLRCNQCIKTLHWRHMTEGTWNHPGQKKFGLVPPLIKDFCSTLSLAGFLELIKLANLFFLSKFFFWILKTVKNPEYGRQSISRLMRIVAPIP